MELGQHYAEFKQYDEAIECFSWEMELHPEDSAPVGELSKMYLFKRNERRSVGLSTNLYSITKESGDWLTSSLPGCKKWKKAD